MPGTELDGLENDISATTPELIELAIERIADFLKQQFISPSVP
jgi:hypothetical protein